MLTLAFGLYGWLATAAAQTFDAHGPAVPVDGASVRDPLLGHGAQSPDAPVVSVLGEAASRLLLLRVSDGPDVYDDPVLDALFGVNVGASLALTRRVSVGASLPVWLASGGLAGGGLAPGDASLWVPVEILQGETRLAVVPFASFPTGADQRYLGDPGVVGGGVLSAGLDRGLLTAHADVGLDVAPATGAPEWPGGTHGRMALDVGVIPSDTVGLHAEWRTRSPLFRSGPTVPSELMGTVKLRPEDRLFVSFGLGRALTRGVGAGGMHMLFSLSTPLGGEDGTSQLVSGPAPKEVHVVDERSFPIHNAKVTSGGVTVLTDHEGYADLPVRAVRSGFIEVTHPGYEVSRLEGVSVEDPWWEIALQRRPVPLAVSVVGPKGVLESVDITVQGESDPGEPSVDEAGVRHWKLPAGTWTVSMSSPGYGAQQRTIVIDPNRTDPIRVDAVLASLEDPDTILRVEVVDALGRPVEDAVVALEDRDLGTTGTAGDLVVQGVSEGEHAVVVRSEMYGEGSVVKVVVEDGEQTVRATLDWQPGSVQVKVSDPTGRPTDATVSFFGPANLPSRTVGSDGEELFVLRPGSWELRFTSTGFAPQVRRMEVTERPGELTVLDVRLLPEEAGPAELDLRVVDVDGNPIPDVAVTLDGRSVGTTGPTGELVLLGLETGTRLVELGGDLLVPKITEVELVDGRQIESVPMWWVDGVVDLWVVDERMRPLDATVDLVGPEPVEQVQLGPDGYERLMLPSGDWNLTFVSGDLGTQARAISIVPDSRRRHSVQVQLVPLEPELGNLALRLLPPEGSDFRNAHVSLDGAPVGVITGELFAQGLPVGPVEIGVEGEALQPATLVVDIVTDTNVELPLQWAPGALEVEVVGPDGPVEADLTIRGPKTVTPRSTVNGTALLGLSPGHWWVSAEHPTLGTEEVEIDLPEAAELTRLAIRIEPVAEEKATVVLRAETPEGVPLANAEVKVDGVVVGRTSGAGTLEVEELPPSVVLPQPEPPKRRNAEPVEPPSTTVKVEIVPEGDYDAIEVPVKVQAGDESQHTVVVPHKPRPVSVNVASAEGEPVQAEIVAVGASETRATSEGGAASLDLAPGAYTVTARTADGSLATAEIVVRPDDTPEVSLVVDKVDSKMGDSNRLMPAGDILFDLDQVAIREDAKPLLDDLARWLSANQSAALIEVAGHTDDQGGVTYNQQLSERRAVAVKRALIARGVAPERLVARGYGLSRPVTTETDPESRQRNRRVEIVVRQWNR